MIAAILTLQNALDTLRTNEPISRQEGNDDQADLELESADEIEHALEVLRAITRYDNVEPTSGEGWSWGEEEKTLTLYYDCRGLCSYTVVLPEKPPLSTVEEAVDTYGRVFFGPDARPITPEQYHASLTS